jgi:RHS repeat-associated protein
VQQNSYKFTGEQFDPELNSYYQRARYYNPNTGRFTSRDSFEGFLERPLSLNKYSYTEGNPINAIDPSGKITFLERAIFFVPVGISLFGIIQASQECIDPYSPLISPTNPVVDFTNNFIASQICETLRTVTNALKQVNQ